MPKAATSTLRPTLTPGTVCIILAGRFRGRRVVYLKELAKSKTLLVTGPYKVNGVPLRRVDPAYVIATSTKLDLATVALPADLNDDFFKLAENTTPKGKGGVSDARLKAQQAVDAALLKALSTEQRAYLGSVFTLSSNDKPHAMKF